MKKNKIKKDRGFFRLIIVIVIALILLRYYHITFYEILAWAKTLSLDKIIAWLQELFKGFFAK